MADALEWGMTERPAYTLAVGTKSGGAETSGVGGSGARRGLNRERDKGRWVIDTGRAWGQRGPESRGQTVDVGTNPDPTLTAKSGGQWVIERPSTTIMGDPRVFQPGGHHTPGAQTQNAIKITVREALILQSFRPDYPVQGTKTRQFEQVGNAIPPLLALRILEALLAPFGEDLDLPRNRSAPTPAAPIPGQRDIFGNEVPL